MGNKVKGRGVADQAIYMGIDVHEQTYRVSLFCQGEEFHNKGYPAEYKHLRRLVERFSACKVYAVYEAGVFGYELHDRLERDGVSVMVAPPSKVPREPGESVKNDKRDCRKLAHLLYSGMLKSVSVPSKAIREDRDLLRTRDQFVSQRVRLYQQIQSKLRFHGLPLRLSGAITPKWREAILQLPGLSGSLRLAFEFLLDSYAYYTEQLKKLRRAVLEMSEQRCYGEKIEVIVSIPGIGILTALSWVLELPPMRKFKDNQRLASYLGLTPSEFSSGAHQRQGRITRQGNAKIRWLLVECAWKLIRRDRVMNDFYERLKRRRGGKRAIVAVARKLSGRIRTILINQENYAVGTLA